MRRWMGPAVAAALVAACVSMCVPMTASAGERPSLVAAASPVTVACGAGEIELPAHWYFPGGGAPAHGLAWLQHGFFRQDAAVADLASRLARAGFVVFTPTVPSLRLDCGFNNLEFVGNLGALFGTASNPDGPLAQSARAAARQFGLAPVRLPERYLFSGHSAGGAAVTFAASAFVTRHPDLAHRLKGLVLLDPVESPVRSMQFALPALVDVPVYTIAAPPSACNAGTSGSNALLALGRSFVGIQVTDASHCDAEGASSDILCRLACGASRPGNVAVLQLLAIGWSADLLLDRTTAALYPGGGFYQALADAGVIRTY